MSGLQLSPPIVRIDKNLTWLLCAAFSDFFDGTLPHDSAAALESARQLEISGRIAARLQSERRTLLDPAERDWRADYHTNLAVDAQLNQALKQVADVALRHSIPLIALKYAALRLADASRPGTRVAGDLDLLVAPESAAVLNQALLKVGFARVGTRSYPHQLAALVGPYGAVVELHLHVPGVCIGTPHFATAGDLLAAALVAPVSGSSLLVPSLPILVAHALAHGMLQNRSTPQSYSLFRMLADIADLRTLGTPDSITSAQAFLDPSLTQVCEVTDRLCVALSRGIFRGPGFEGTPEETLLWHCLAARLDTDYSEELRGSGFIQKLRGPFSGRELFRYFSGALFPSDAELDAIYGPATSRVARLRRRCTRPFDIARRAVRRYTTRASRPR